MTIRIRYDLIGSLKAGVTEHPGVDIRSRGFCVLDYEGCPIADRIFMTLDGDKENLPPYAEIRGELPPSGEALETPD